MAIPTNYTEIQDIRVMREELLENVQQDYQIKAKLNTL